MKKKLVPLALAATLSTAGLLAQATPPAPQERPVALVLSASGGSLLRPGSELPLAVRPGDLLFPGDSLKSSAGTITFLYCPERVLHTLSANGEAQLDATRIQVKTGQLGNRTPAPYCFLPQMSRMGAASQMHNGASVRRSLRPEGETPAGTYATRVAALPADRRAALQSEIQPIDQAIAADAANPAPRLARAEVLARYGLAADASEEYNRIAKIWPEAAWLKARLFTLEEEAEKGGPALATAAAPGQPGRTFALLVGVSKYQSPDIRPLNFAHEDANLMEQYLRSDRGGKLGDDDIVLLANEKATTAAIRNAFETFLKGRAGKNDTVILLIATHGTVVDVKGKRGAYIISYDSDPQDLATTALPMDDIQKLIREDLTGVGRVMAFVDVCRSGTIGTIPSNSKVASVVERLAETEGQLFLFTASRANEFSFEGPQYGGGHGAFSFFLLEAINGPGDLNNDGNVSINELIEYTQTKVVEGTADRQHPRESGNYEGGIPVANAKLAGITMAKFTPVPQGGDRTVLAAARSIEPLSTALNRPRAAILKEAVDFEEALGGGRLLPDAPRNAFTALRQFRRTVKPDQYSVQVGRLQSTLEDRGQQVILRYLKGDQEPQARDDFAAAAAFFGAAKLLAPESVLLESRETFSLGRMRLFEKDYQGATQLLERAVRLDPEGAYSYNALGIAALEQADYDRAAAAFRDATRRAPLWAYPRHNLALTYTQLGNYDAAIQSYREAMRLAPAYAYLPYNLGLVYQRLNRRRDAEASFRQAMSMSPDSAVPLNALGFLYADSGKRRDAEQFYRQAIAKDPAAPEARHNLAVLLAARRETADDAVKLWRENLDKASTHLPSRLSLAKSLDTLDRRAEAITEYRAVLALRPGYAAAHLALAGLLERDAKPAEALAAFTEAARLQPANGLAWEKIGDLERAAGRTAEAAAAYKRALEQTNDGATKKRIQRKTEPRP